MYLPSEKIRGDWGFAGTPTAGYQLGSALNSLVTPIHFSILPSPLLGWPMTQRPVSIPCCFAYLFTSPTSLSAELCMKVRSRNNTGPLLPMTQFCRKANYPQILQLKTTAVYVVYHVSPLHWANIGWAVILVSAGILHGPADSPKSCLWFFFAIWACY